MGFRLNNNGESRAVPHGEKSSQVTPLLYLSKPGLAPALPCKKQVVWSQQTPYGDPPLSTSSQSVGMTTGLPDPVPSLHPRTCVLPGISSTGCLSGWRRIFTNSVKTLPVKSSRWTSRQASLLMMALELAALLTKAQTWGLRKYHRGRGGAHLEPC